MDSDTAKLTFAALFVACGLACSSCTQSPADARKEFNAIGVAFTPIDFVQAIHNDDERAVRLFLAAGMDPIDVRDMRYGGEGVPLRAAGRRGRTNIARMLLDAGAPVDSGPPTALVEAATHGHIDVAVVLLEAGANPNAEAKTGRLRGGTSTPLSMAAENGHAAVLAALLEAGADPDAGDPPPLYRAADCGRTEIVRALLSAGADPRASKKDTAIGLADLQRRAGSQPERRISALEAARAKGHEEIAGLLSRALGT